MRLIWPRNQIWVIGVCLALLDACTPPAIPREGAPDGRVYPQASEQCRAQPDLDWCHAR